MTFHIWNPESSSNLYAPVRNGVLNLNMWRSWGKTCRNKQDIRLCASLSKTWLANMKFDINKDNNLKENQCARAIGNNAHWNCLETDLLSYHCCKSCRVLKYSKVRVQPRLHKLINLSTCSNTNEHAANVFFSKSELQHQALDTDFVPKHSYRNDSSIIALPPWSELQVKTIQQPLRLITGPACCSSRSRIKAHYLLDMNDLLTGPVNNHCRSPLHRHHVFCATGHLGEPGKFCSAVWVGCAALQSQKRKNTMQSQM